MNRRVLLWALMIIVLCPSYAQVRISEVMPCNLSTVMDNDYYNFSGFVELYNGSDTVVSLRGCQFVHYKRTDKGKLKVKWSYAVEQDIQLQPKDFQLVWMDEMTKLNHLPYKLDADGGALVISKDGTVLDSLSYAKAVPHVSFGRYKDTMGYMSPSPRKKNTQSYATLEGKCAAPLFDVTARLVEEPFYLTITSETKDAVIYYTTDGSEPSETNGIRYDQPLYLDAGTAIRCVAVKKGHLRSDITTATYIFKDERHQKCGGYTLPIVAITVDSAYFYSDSIGICVVGTNGVRGEKNCTSAKANYNREWKRPVNFEYIVDGEQDLSMEVEASVEGGCSRTSIVKSLALKSSKKSGQEEFDYYFFQSKPDIKHQTIYLRNGGTAYSRVRFRDGLMQTFAIDMNIDYQAFQPVAYYINGKYVGFMDLNERTNADYVKANYGIDEDDIDLVTISDVLGVRASKGDLDAYNELVKFVSTSDQKDSLFYPKVCEMMDMPEYMDYQVIEQFMVNTDWPGNNSKIWRERKEGSKFRWILFDMDFGLGLPGYTNISNKSINMFNWCQGKKIVSWANGSSWMTKLFKGLSQNTQFRIDFIETYKRHLETTFSEEHIVAVFDSMTTLMNEEYCATFNVTATSAASSMLTMALARPNTIRGQMSNYLAIDTLSVNDVASQPLVLVYPNPTTDELHVMSEVPVESVSLFSADGREWMRRRVEDTYVELDVTSLPSGIYLLQMVTPQGVVVRKIQIVNN